MRKTTIGAILLVLLAAALLLSWRLIQNAFDKERVARTSDAANAPAILRIGGDGYLGYWFITSPEMRRQAAARGLSVQFADDGGDYAARLDRLASGALDAIVLPIGSYIERGAGRKFPGVVVAGVAESKGADAIVGFSDRFPSGKVSELNDASLRIVYTGASPSSFLLDLTIVDFDLFNLAASPAWRVEAKGVREVCDAIRAARGDAFVLWEPELSRALAETPALKRLWGSEKLAGYIVDVIVFSRDALRARERDALAFLQAYFATLSVYALDRPRLVAEMGRSTGLKPEALEAILPTIDWLDLWENGSRLFGIAPGEGRPSVEGLVNAISACSAILVRVGRLPRDPFEGNPHSIIYSALMRRLLESAPAAIGGRAADGAPRFPPLDEAAWARLREVGTMRVEPISFQTGGNTLDDMGKEQVDRVAALLTTNYPSFRVSVRGHTGPGDEAENLALSLERAQAVVQRLIVVHGLEPERLRAEGMGASSPPPRRPGETERAYRYRWPRVEFTLLEPSSL